MPVDPPVPNRPFRWDLVRRDQLGSLLEGCDEPNLWFLDALIECAAKVLARCADGDLYFVGRSADSIYDLLGGALSATSWQGRLTQLPLSMFGRAVEDLSPADIRQLRVNLASTGISPAALQRRARPLVFTDLVFKGSTFGNLFQVMNDWITAERAPWDVIRHKLRFVSITQRGKTSPNTWRWHQQAEWTSRLPASAVINVSLDRLVWHYLGDHQPKLTASFHRSRWADDAVRSPQHSARTRQALAEAVAVVEQGRTRTVRQRLARAITTEPTMTEPWLRALVQQLRSAPRRCA